MVTALKVIDFAGYAIHIDIDVKNEINNIVMRAPHHSLSGEVDNEVIQSWTSYHTMIAYSTHLPFALSVGTNGGREKFNIIKNLSV